MITWEDGDIGRAAGRGCPQCLTRQRSNGYHPGHNFGHGKQYLARTFVAMNLLAFAFHTVCDCLETLWQQARTAIAARVRFFRHISTISAYLLFPDWTSLMNILISAKAPPP